ncbi:DUF6057 family protein [Maribellus mangrovi]|uniref:DUF6057 family protein n=1 Tax=Maribellus mangrovi TaxID=3133146 RepID=UPI0030EE57C3
MNTVPNKTNFLIRLIPYALLLLFTFLFLYSFTDYIFYYQEKSSLFLVTFSFLTQQLDHPGGFLEYLGKLQSTFYFYPFVGALMVSVEICGIIFLTSRLGRKLVAERFILVPFIIGSLLFFLQTNYQYQTLNNLGILFQLLLFLGIIAIPSKHRWISLILVPVTYFLFGSFSYLLLGMLTLFFLLEKSWLQLLLTWLGLVVFFFLGKEFLFYQTTSTLLVFPFSITDIGGQLILFGMAGLLMVLIPVLGKIHLKSVENLKIRRVGITEFFPFLILLLLAVAVFMRVDKKNEHYFHAEKLFYEQKFDELIRFNSRVPTNNKLTLFLNNVALTETGRLGDSFFKFRQSPDGSTLFLKWENIGQFIRFGGYYYYAVGIVNEAQRWAYEYTVIYGYTPETIKMLIKTELIKGNYKTAEKYISILEKSVFYKKEAYNFRKFLNNDEAVLADKELGAKKRIDTQLDFFVKSDEPWLNLLPVLEADSTNRIALEYEMAWLMLQKDMKGIIELLPSMERAGFKRIPKNVEEAVVTYKLLRVGEMPVLNTLQIDPKTEQRFQRYYQIFQQNQRNKLQAQSALREFADTYWYYVFFE